MKRRTFVKVAAATPVMLWLTPTLARPRKARSLVLVKLAGGNDSLNTVIPAGSDAYYDARPTLAVPESDVLALDRNVGLHPALSPLMPLWKDKSLAVVHGVGYPSPNRSHFRSTDIWETSSRSDEYLSDGWLAGIAARGQSTRTSDAFVLGQGDLGALRGGTSRTITMENPEAFVTAARGLATIAPGKRPSALNHILTVQADVKRAAREVENRLPDEAAADFPRTRIGRQLELASRLLAAGLGAPVISVTHKGFDTHQNQSGPHGRLLKELAEALVAFREAGRGSYWRDTLVMTYSEFGRRVAENGSGGTDHGTAASHFLLGGRVKGGQYGQFPSLHELNKGDLRHTTHFKRLYATAAKHLQHPLSDAKALF